MWRFNATYLCVMWRYFLYVKLIKFTNMSNLREKAIEIAKQTSSESAFMCGYDRACQEYEEKLRWIAVEEMLPEIGERVLLKNEFYEYVGFLSKNNKDFRALTVELSYSNEKRSGVTHWRYFL